MSVKQQLNGGPTDWLVRAIIGAGFAWALYAVAAMKEALTDHQSHLAAVESKLDAHIIVDDSIELRTQIAALREAVAVKADSKDVPPPEVLRELERLEQRIVRIEEKIFK